MIQPKLRNWPKTPSPNPSGVLTEDKTSALMTAPERQKLDSLLRQRIQATELLQQTEPAQDALKQRRPVSNNIVASELPPTGAPRSAKPRRHATVGKATTTKTQES
jgi:hypothetical protein